jgi:hypothetical protein
MTALSEYAKKLRCPDERATPWLIGDDVFRNIADKYRATTPNARRSMCVLLDMAELLITKSLPYLIDQHLCLSPRFRRLGFGTCQAILPGKNP